MKTRMFALYAFFICVLVVDLCIAMFGVVRAFQGEDMRLVLAVSLINPLMFVLVFLDDGEDIYQEEVNKRLLEIKKDYGL